MFHPNYNGEVAYFGFARPAFGSIPPTSEMQSRFFAMVTNGDIKLPCRAKQVEIALEDKVRGGQVLAALAWCICPLVRFLSEFVAQLSIPVCLMVPAVVLNKCHFRSKEIQRS